MSICMHSAWSTCLPPHIPILYHLHSMSRCPDALDCESRLDEVVQRIGKALTVRFEWPDPLSSRSSSHDFSPHPFSPAPFPLTAHTHTHTHTHTPFTPPSAHAQVRTHYLANISDTGAAACKHGAMECAGDVQQLCMQRHASPEVFWKFLMCQNSNFDSVGGCG